MGLFTDIIDYTMLIIEVSEQPMHIFGNRSLRTVN